MAMLLAHLTDMHFCADDDALLLRAEALGNAITADIGQDVDAVHIIMGGDFAQSGKEIEFKAASLFLERVRDSFQRSKPGLAIKFIAVPGNHDCDFSGNQTLRESALATIQQAIASNGKPDHDTERVILKPLINYFEFVAKIPHSVSLSLDSPYYAVHDLSCGEHCIRYHLFNSAWMSVMHEAPGTLHFPIGEIKPSLETQPALQICVHHHPYNWFSQPSAMRPFRDRVESLGDIVLTGHEHSGSVYGKLISGKASACYIEGTVLQEFGRREVSGFQTIRVSLEDNSAEVATYSWQGEGLFGHYARRGDKATIQWAPVAQRTSILRLRSLFESSLNDPGLPVNHRSRGALRLADFYVSPDLRTLDDSVSVLGRRVLGENVVEELVSTKRAVVVAHDKSGKTSFTKRLFVDLHAQGYAPLLISGAKLPRSGKSDAIRQYLHKCVAEQYEFLSPEAYEQLQLDKRIVIMDDLQNGPEPEASRSATFLDLHSRFGMSVFLTSEHFYFDELLEREAESLNGVGRALEKYRRYFLMPLGYRRCEQLVQRWVGLAPLVDQNAFEERVQEILGCVEEVLRTNAIPHHPWVVLVLIQSADSPDAPAAENGSYGHLLNAVITAALNRSRIAKLPLNGKYAYLGSLANHLFELGVSVIDQVDVQAFHEAHQREYGLPHIDFESIIKDFEDAGILDWLSGKVSFHHKYTFCFFVAWHLSQRLNEQDSAAAQTVRRLSENLFHEDTADIIVFLAHLTTAKIVLQEILDRGNSAYKDIAPTDFDTDLKPFAGLSGVVASFILPDSDPDENRRRLREVSDEQAATRGLRAQDGRSTELRPPKDLSSDEDPAYQGVRQITSAFRIIEILGQVLRNGATTRKIDEKILIAETVFGLGRRILGFLYKIDPDRFSLMIERLESNYRHRFPKATDQQIASDVSEHIFKMYGFASFAVVKHVASAVGDDGLSETFRQVLDRDRSLPNEVYDLAIKLDKKATSLPVKQADTLNKSLSKNPFVSNIVRALVVEHLYLYKVPAPEKQSICDRLEIVLDKRVLDPAEKKRLN